MAEVLQPLIIEVGKKKKRDIRSLSTGRVMHEVERGIQSAVARLQAEHPDKKIVPVITVVRRKKKSSPATRIRKRLGIS